MTKPLNLILRDKYNCAIYFERITFSSVRPLPCSFRAMFNGLLLCTGFLLGFQSYAQSKLPPCQGSDTATWTNCYGNFTYSDGRQYVGEYMKGKRNGQGTVTFKEGAKHVGEFKDDKANGQGTLTYPNGDQYVGEFRDGLFTGQGTLISPTIGQKYVGEWRDGKWNGKGTITFADGNQYVGEFKDDKYNGHGTETLSNGQKYVGEYKDDKYNGQGTITLANGQKYVGEWKDGKYNGQGTITLANGDQYVGEFKDDNYNGQGTATLASGQKYVGEFKDDKYNGQGTLTLQDGQKYVGEFKNGKYNGYGTLTDSTGRKFVGEFKNGKYNGRGTMTYGDSRAPKEGIWEDNYLIRAEKLSTQPNLALEGDRKKLEEDKRQLAEERKRLEDDKQKPVMETSITLAAPTSFSQGRRLALVIGNAAYTTRPLSNPRNVADDVSRALKGAGFDVIDLRDATLSQMRSATRQFGEKLMTNDVGLVYYSGHGIEVKGKNYFIPVNADIKSSDEVADQALDVSLILAKMDSAKKGVNILIVDACRDDPFGRSYRSNSRGLAAMDAPQGTIIAYATSPGNVAADGSGRNSPYTRNLVKAMQTPNLPVELMFKEVRRAVREETRNQQTPWENTSLSGNFYFKVQK